MTAALKVTMVPLRASVLPLPADERVEYSNTYG